MSEPIKVVRMNAKHTPGPWHLLVSGTMLQVSGSTEHDNENAVVHWAGFDSSDKPWPEKLANARLIVAAPDLVKALRECYSHLGWHPSKIPAHVAEETRAILRKAGEEII